MASALPPVKGAAFSFELSLVSQADTDTFQDNPTLAAGDVKVIKDGTLDGNIDTLPTAVTSLTRVITVALSADEMTADRVTVLFHDAAGSEWQDALVTIYTAAQTLDTTDGVADGIKAKTDYLPAVAAGASGGLPILGANAAGMSLGGQVKILADVSSQGALHVVNSNADGQGVMYIGGEYGQVNSGVSSNVVGVDAAGIRTAIGLATANLDTQLAALPTDQDVRDAMKLAPTAGDPAAGSVDKHLDDLLTYADAAEPADVWSYVSRTLTATPASTTDGTTAGAITRKRGNSWSIALTLGAITGYTSLWFTIKRSYDDADSASVVQVKLNATGLLDGLLYVNGAAATNDALGGITVSDASTGAIVVALDETVTDDIAPGTYYYDAQALISGAVTTPDSGTFTVTADVTRSVT